MSEDRTAVLYPLGKHVNVISAAYASPNNSELWEPRCDKKNGGWALHECLEMATMTTNHSLMRHTVLARCETPDNPEEFQTQIGALVSIKKKSMCSTYIGRPGHEFHKQHCGKAHIVPPNILFAFT